MKSLLLVVVLIAGAFGRSAVKPQAETFAEGPACPIEDPLQRDGPFPINVTVDPLAAILEGSQISNLQAEGLSTLHYVININVLLLTVNFDVTLQRGTGNATFNADGYLDARPISQETIPSGNFTGSGLGKLSAEGLRVKGNARLFINLIGNKVGIRTLNLEIVNFDALSIDLGENITIGGQNIDWNALNQNLKANFDREWAEKKAEITEKIRQTANSIVGKYTLQELIDLIGGGGGGGGGDC